MDSGCLLALRLNSNPPCGKACVELPMDTKTVKARNPSENSQPLAENLMANHMIMQACTYTRAHTHTDSRARALRHAHSDTRTHI